MIPEECVPIESDGLRKGHALLLGKTGDSGRLDGASDLGRSRDSGAASRVLESRGVFETTIVKVETRGAFATIF